MILLDTNVWIDAFAPGAPHHAWAAEIVRQGVLGEGIAINPVILAELCVGDCQPDTVWERLDQLGVTLLDLPARTSWRCAKAYGEYLENRRQTDAPRKRRCRISSLEPMPRSSICPWPRRTPNAIGRTFRKSDC